MKSFVFFVSILFNSVVIGQNKDFYPSPPLSQKVERSNKTKYSLQKRLSFCPFNECSQIKLVSFGLKLDSNQRKVEDNYKLPTLNDSVFFSRLDEVKTLSKKQIDTLSDILFNECSRWNFAIYTESDCYYPRNAIQFLNKTGNIFDYIEIALECKMLKTGTQKSIRVNECNEMYSHLESFFKRFGLKTSDYEVRKLGR